MKQTDMMLSKLRLHLTPVLVASYPVLYLFVSNRSQTTFAATLPAFGLMWVLAIGCQLWGGWIFKNWPKAAIFSSVLTALFSLHGHLHAVLHKLVLKKDFQLEIPGIGKRWFFEAGLHLILTALEIGIFVKLTRWLKSATREAAALNQGLSTFAIILCALPLAQLGLMPSKDPSRYDGQVLDPAVWKNAAPLQQDELVRKPDIYYIILDGYAREDTLKEFYGYDNSVFLDGLRARGFEVAANSHSNFYFTFMSLSSSLNMEYINRIAEIEGPKSKDRSKLYHLVRENRVAKFLRQKGYEFVHFQSTWGATEINPYADRLVACDAGVMTEEFNRVFIEATWLRTLSSSLGADLATCWKAHFESLAQMARERGPHDRPRFIFAHFMLPHHPYLFDKEGNILREAHVFNQFEFQKNLWAKKGAYVSQLEFVSKQMTSIVDRLQKESTVPPIIALASDHGSHIDTDDEEKSHLLRVRNLVTLSLPGKKKPVLYDSITPVNLFRTVLNEEFDTQLPLLPDRSYFSSHGQPYYFKPIETATDASRQQAKPDKIAPIRQ